MARLKQLLAEGIDPAHNFMYGLILKGFQSVGQLESSLEEVLAHLLPSTDKHMSRFLQVFLHNHIDNENNSLTTLKGVLYHIVKTQNLPEIKAMAILRALGKSNLTPPRVANLCQETLAVNNLGPIVFVTPEFGRFSTVGGVGVMLDGIFFTSLLLFLFWVVN